MPSQPDVASLRREKIQGLLKREPRVGIWWLLTSRKLLIYSIPISQAVRYGNTYVGAIDHQPYWEHLRLNHHEIAHLNFDQVPRGKVIYNFRTMKFRIVAGSNVLSSRTAVNAIKRRFRLQGAKVIHEYADNFELFPE